MRKHIGGTSESVEVSAPQEFAARQWCTPRQQIVIDELLRDLPDPAAREVCISATAVLLRNLLRVCCTIWPNRLQTLP
jgi:hypothetical protein